MQQQNNRKSNDIQRFLKALTTNINWINSLLAFLFIGTLYLTVLEIDIFRKTLISWIIPTFIWFFTGLILTPLTSNFLKKHIGTDSFFLQLVYNIVTWGGLILYGFMAANYYFPINDTKKIKTNIIKTGHFARGRYGTDCAQPYCEVEINGKKKRLVFLCDFDIEKYNSIDLTIKKGLWGFDIITDKTPKDEKQNAL